MKLPRVELDPPAARLLAERLAARGLGHGGLRIGFLYGCGGAGYRLTLADGPWPGDLVVQLDGARVFADAVAAEALDGARIVVAEGELTLDHPDAVMVEYCG